MLHGAVSRDHPEATVLEDDVAPPLVKQKAAASCTERIKAGSSTWKCRIPKLPGYSLFVRMHGCCMLNNTYRVSTDGQE
jgi:hypothetical protein